MKGNLFPRALALTVVVSAAFVPAHAQGAGAQKLAAKREPFSSKQGDFAFREVESPFTFELVERDARRYSIALDCRVRQVRVTDGGRVVGFGTYSSGVSGNHFMLLGVEVFAIDATGTKTYSKKWPGVAGRLPWSERIPKSIVSLFDVAPERDRMTLVANYRTDADAYRSALLILDTRAGVPVRDSDVAPIGAGTADGYRMVDVRWSEDESVLALTWSWTGLRGPPDGIGGADARGDWGHCISLFNTDGASLGSIAVTHSVAPSERAKVSDGRSGGVLLEHTRVMRLVSIDSKHVVHLQLVDRDRDEPFDAEFELVENAGARSIRRR